MKYYHKKNQYFTINKRVYVYDNDISLIRENKDIAKN